MGENIKSTSSLGKTTYHNIETGYTYTVPWGGADWLLAVLMTAFGLAALALVAGLALQLWGP
jgi:hypothetical protein